MKHARSDYSRFRDPATICRKYGLPVGRWTASQGCVTAPDGAVFDVEDEVLTAFAGSTMNGRISQVIAELLTCEPDTEGIPDDEPVFLLRAQDITAPIVVRFWANRAAVCGAAAPIVEAAYAQAKAMIDWQTTHRVQVPDMPEPTDT